jgi:hypothetical protein
MGLAAGAAAELADFADGRGVRRRGPGPPRRGSVAPPSLRLNLGADGTSLAGASEQVEVAAVEDEAASRAERTMSGADLVTPAGANAAHDRVAERVLPSHAPAIHLGARVRADVDMHVSEVIASLRRLGIRTNRTELFEMLLWGLEPGDALVHQLRDFRARNPAPGRRIS